MKTDTSQIGMLNVLVMSLHGRRLNSSVEYFEI